MSASTTGIRIRVRSRALRQAVELISSMRFAISLLTVMASGHDPGNINWPQQVRAAASAVGVTLP